MRSPKSCPIHRSLPLQIQQIHPSVVFLLGLLRLVRHRVPTFRHHPPANRIVLHLERSLLPELRKSFIELFLLLLLSVLQIGVVLGSRESPAEPSSSSDERATGGEDSSTIRRVRSAFHGGTSRKLQGSLCRRLRWSKKGSSCIEGRRIDGGPVEGERREGAETKLIISSS